MIGNAKRLQGGLVLGAFLWLGLAQGAHAVDGVIEINHACAEAGCFPGDTAGYPVTISSPGSYRLTTNLALTPPNQNTDVIVVTSDRVSIDLNGFAITGTSVCSGCPVTSCSNSGTGVGIRKTTGSSLELTQVRNGTIKGMGSRGIEVAGGLVVQETVVSNNASGGVVTTSGGFGLVRVTLTGNGGDGANGDVLYPSLATLGAAVCNQGDGIEAGMSSRVTDFQSSFNGLTGVKLSGGSHVSQVVARSNLGVALNLTADSVYSSNVLTCNNSAFSCTNGAQVTGGVELLGGFGNFCGTDTSCP